MGKFIKAKERFYERGYDIVAMQDIVIKIEDISVIEIERGRIVMRTSHGKEKNLRYFDDDELNKIIKSLGVRNE